eukprot:COSAG01_NODE_5838_length_4003_cov_2.848617_2_plen_370_part_00
MFLPESEAVAKGICARPNICSLLTYHTYGGEIRDPLAATDAHDLNAFEQLTAQGVAATGYRKVRSGIGGAFLQWAYDHRGIVAYLTELWDLLGEAGLDFTHATAGMTSNDASAHKQKLLSEDKVAQILAWCEDQRLPAGSYWQDWAPYEHPQLGRVELGGWKWKYLSQNPPPMLLEAELAKNTEFALVLAQALPRVVATEVEALSLGGGNTRLRVTFTNTGFLPTYGSKQAIAVHAVKPTAVVTLRLPPLSAAPEEGVVELVSGCSLSSQVPHLEGRCRAELGSSALNPFMAHGIAGGEGWWVSNRHQVRLEWVLRTRGGLGEGEGGATIGHGAAAAAAGLIEVSADFGRGGRVRVPVQLGGADNNAKL